MEEGTVVVPPAELVVDDVVVVRPGGRVPADGEVIDGGAAVDESMITGESSPVQREVGDRVVAGTVATDNSLRVRITAIGEDTALAGIQRLVADAQASSTRAQLLADRAAGWLFWYALGSALVAATVWTFVGTPQDALVRAITVLVIACPTRWAWRSRWWSRSPRSGRRRWACSSRTAGRSSACGPWTPSSSTRPAPSRRVNRA